MMICGSYLCHSSPTIVASASRTTPLIVRIAASGHRPLAISPESITASAPSVTALATSETSARVGRGLVTMDSSICVAQITGFPSRLHFAIMSFCATKTLGAGISMPRSPLATITPSLSAKISSKFCKGAACQVLLS